MVVMSGSLHPCGRAVSAEVPLQRRKSPPTAESTGKYLVTLSEQAMRAHSWVLVSTRGAQHVLFMLTNDTTHQMRQCFCSQGDALFQQCVMQLQTPSCSRFAWLRTATATGIFSSLLTNKITHLVCQGVCSQCVCDAQVDQRRMQLRHLPHMPAAAPASCHMPAAALPGCATPLRPACSPNHSNSQSFEAPT